MRNRSCPLRITPYSLLNDLQLRMECAGFLERLKDRNDVPRRDLQLVHRPHEFLEGIAGLDVYQASPILSRINGRLSHDRRIALLRQRGRLGHLLLLRDFDAQVAMGNRHRREPHSAADDDGAGPLIDYDLGDGGFLDRKLAYVGDEGDRILARSIDRW